MGTTEQQRAYSKMLREAKHGDRLIWDEGKLVRNDTQKITYFEVRSIRKG